MAFLECFLYVFYPTLLGYIFNVIAEHAPSVFGIFYYASPLLLFFGWFWAGRRYYKHLKNPALAIVAGNSIGILSLLVYLWQEYLAIEKINWLQSLSQCFPVSVTLLSAPIVIKFSPEVDGVIQVSNTALQCIGFVLVVIVFVGGYFYERNREKLETTNNNHPKKL